MENLGVDLFSSFYRNKVVLITGHTGFKGSWLSIWLNELGAKVIGYGLKSNTDNDNFEVAGLADRIIDIRGDIRDYENLQHVFEKYKPQIVFHLAAQPLVRLSYENPKETYEINLMGTLNVLQCIRNSESVKVGIIVTTDKCYENKEQIWSYRENDAMGGYDPYSSSKACTELLIASYRNSFMNPKDYPKHQKSVASVRAGNVIGGGDWSKDRIVPDCIKALMENRAIEIRNPSSIRPWQYVLEPLSGYMLLAFKMYNDGIKYSGAWNFGPNEDSIIPVKRIVTMLIDNWGCGYSIDKPDTNAPHEANLLSLDCTKAKKHLNWFPKLNIEDTIKLTVDWYKHFSDKDVYSLCVKQIESYCKS
jgi:CDP-glucose 4,6-dehydratase